MNNGVHGSASVTPAAGCRVRPCLFSSPRRHRATNRCLAPDNKRDHEPATAPAGDSLHYHLLCLLQLRLIILHTKI